ncbi:MAG: cytochrome c peroxidase [Phenylobacterium sp.]|jgi:cytochrome c peroxidase
MSVKASPKSHSKFSLKTIPLIIAMGLSMPVASSYAADLGTPDVDDIEYPEDEAPSKLEVTLGKTLFFDPRLSLNQVQSCASCHNPDLGFGDGMAGGIGTMGGNLGRNTPHIYNLAWSTAMFWDGRMDTLEQQALGPIEAAGEMNMPLNQLLPRLKAVPYYTKTFKKVYGSEGLTKENLGRALASFERTIVSDNSPFDRYIAGDKAAMSPAAIRGLELFKNKANCIDCHDGVNFTDDSFHNIGIGDKDPGRAAISGEKSMTGAFKTTGLRNTLLTAPYMHDGSSASLEEVVQHYNKGGNPDKHLDKLIKPLGLSTSEVFDLVAFMGALTDPVVIERPTIPK